ncbi:MAG: ABC-2 transporter permease [Candidatus Delongbacteria bacterium]|jgi:hypothetical protein|nr:ABC-2 transporter permease [Candidatus Delongbacteria bacterium]
MLKLIIADIKVLGHRIWAIPLGVFLFIMMFSFIPYLDQVQQFQNWIFAILIPGLLTFELFREEQKSGTDKMLMTMPVSKVKYVWSKYITVIGFVGIGIVVGVIARYSLEISNLSSIQPVHHQSYWNMYYSSIFVLKVLIFIIPVYIYSRKLRLSFFFAPSIMFLVYYINHNVYKILIYNTIFPRNIFSTSGPMYFGSIDYVFNILNLVIILLFVHLVISYKYKNKFNAKLLNGWFLVLASVSISATDIIFGKLEFFNQYLWRKKLCIERATQMSNIKMDDKSYGDRFANFLEYMRNECVTEENALIILSIIIVISFITMLIIHQTTKDKFFQKAVLFLMMPIVSIIFGGYIIQILHEIEFEILYLHHGYTLFISISILFTISIKSSIYLLKNNRTLK